MTILGYYAKPLKPKNPNEPELYAFEWDEHDNLYVINNGIKYQVDKNEFEILQIASLDSDD